MKLKILGVHGMWARGDLFDGFKKLFPSDKFEFVTIDIDWDKFEAEDLAQEIEEIAPDIIIAYSFGTYAIQKVFDSYEDYVRNVKHVILMGPIGPRGMGVFSFLQLIISNLPRYIKSVISGKYDLPMSEGKKDGIEFQTGY